MKKIIIGMAFLMATASAFADASSTQSMCMNLTGTQGSPNGTVLGTAQCSVTQTMSIEASSTWSCSFNGQPAQTLNTIGSAGPSYDNSETSTILYDLYPQEDLGNYLLTGLNTPARFGGTMEVVVGNDGSLHVLFSNVDLLTGALDYEHEFNYVNVQSITAGSCNSSS